MKYTLYEWRAEATSRFGDNPANWSFRCPKCGRDTTNREMLEACKAEGTDGRDLAYQECIGRHLPSGGCNWCSYGFLKINDTVVIAPDGREVPVFDFSPVPARRA